MFQKLFQNIFNDISYLIRFNQSDEKEMDSKCNKIFIDYLKNEKNILGFISEEEENIQYLNYNNNVKSGIIISFDPLDGSSNYESNINVGSIYCVYNYDFENEKIIEVLEAGYCLYGPSTILVQSDNDKLNMYLLNNKNQFDFVKEIHFDSNKKMKKIYSINESNTYNKEINYLLTSYKNLNYNMRWVGTMVADVHRILMNDGIFYYPTTDKNPNGKIRLLYEAIPMSYIFKLAGGIGINENYTEILDIMQYANLKKNPHSRMSIILASKKEYKNLKNLLHYFNDD